MVDKKNDGRSWDPKTGCVCVCVDVIVFFVCE